ASFVRLQSIFGFHPHPPKLCHSVLICILTPPTQKTIRGCIARQLESVNKDSDGYRRLREGGITPSGARTLIDLAEGFRKSLEVAELEQRISALEQNSRPSTANPSLKV